MQLESIEKYLNNQMDPAERQTFELAMGTNPSLAEEVASFQDVKQMVNIAGDEAFLNKLKSIEDELAGKTTSVRPFLGRRLVLGIAAAVIILLAGIWILQPQRTESNDLFAENFQAYPAPAHLRGETNENQSWETARTAYIQEDYTQAAQQFEALLALDSIPQAVYLVHFYAGISQLAEIPPKLPGAIGHLQYVAATDSDYYQPAQWYLALAYLKNGEEQKAKVLLEKMVAEGSYRKDAIEALLKELTQ